MIGRLALPPAPSQGHRSTPAPAIRSRWTRMLCRRRLRLCRRRHLVLRCIDMPIASDGKGNFLTLDQNQQWVPARTATNQAGDTLVLDGGEWKPAAAGASTTGAQPSAVAPAPAPAHDSMWPQPPGTKPAAAPSPTPPSAAQPQRYDPSGYPIAPPDQTKPAIPPTLTDPSTWPLPQDPAALRIRQATIDAF